MIFRWMNASSGLKVIISLSAKQVKGCSISFSWSSTYKFVLAPASVPGPASLRFASGVTGTVTHTESGLGGLSAQLLMHIWMPQISEGLTRRAHPQQTTILVQVHIPEQSICQTDPGCRWEEGAPALSPLHPQVALGRSRVRPHPWHAGCAVGLQHQEGFRKKYKGKGNVLK